MTIDVMEMQLTTTHWVWNETLKGITHAQSLVQPAHGNCLNWVGGHVVASRNGLARLVGADPIWEQGRVDRYKRGSAAITGAADDVVPFEEIVADYNRAQAPLLEALRALTPDDLARQVSDKTLGLDIQFLLFHETYHVGQLGLLRRLVGLPGVIQ